MVFELDLQESVAMVICFDVKKRSEDFIKLANYKIIYNNDKSYIISKDC